MSSNNFELIPLNQMDQIVKKLNLVVGNKMILIAGRCTAVFDGRIKSTLAEGDRFLLIKEDLSIVLHGPIGVKPLNWQKPLAGPIKFQTKNSQLEMVTQRTKTKETLVITFSNLTNISIWHAFDESELKIYGDESDLVKYLVSNPTIIEDGFQVLRTEYSTDVGPVDIRGVNDSVEIIVEVKKRNATPKDAHQLKRYIEYFENTEQKKVRGILIAPEFPKKVLNYLEENGLEAKTIHWKEIFPLIKRPKNVKLEEFFEKKDES